MLPLVRFAVDAWLAFLARTSACCWRQGLEAADLAGGGPLNGFVSRVDVGPVSRLGGRGPTWGSAVGVPAWWCPGGRPGGSGSVRVAGAPSATVAR